MLRNVGRKGCLDKASVVHERRAILNIILADRTVSFDPSSAGQVALVIYEWKDVQYLGADTPDNSVGNPPVRTSPVQDRMADEQKTYICTTSAGAWSRASSILWL
jgi:hypothetical protein